MATSDKHVSAVLFAPLWIVQKINRPHRDRILQPLNPDAFGKFGDSGRIERTPVSDEKISSVFRIRPGVRFMLLSTSPSGRQARRRSRE